MFNIRARSLNNLVYYIAQIMGSGAIGFMLDRERLCRRTRAFLGWSILFAMVFIVHIWGYFYQKWAKSLHKYITNPGIREYNRSTYSNGTLGSIGKPRIDIHDKEYVGRIWFYIFCGLLDAMWQTTSYWLMGAMSNDPAKLAFFAGFCTDYLCWFIICLITSSR